MTTFGDRLVEERQRLGLGQAALADIGGVKKLAQINYEKNRRSPDSDYLDRIRCAGIDLVYLFTGQRMPSAIAEPPRLSREEQALLDNYRHCQEEQRAAIRATSAALAEQAAKAIKKPTRASQKGGNTKKPPKRA